MRVALGSDHAGFEQKEQLANYLRGKGYEVENLGPTNEDRVDYPDFAKVVGNAVRHGRADRGILVCGTGIGMAIAANKLDGIRAANVTTPQFAHLAREHNDANVITVSGRFVDLATNEKIVDEFLNTDFGNGRHADRVKKIMDLEEE